MKHFRDDEWLDYVRGISSPSRRAAIEKSLGEGCNHCVRLYDFWRTTWQVGLRGSAYRVPDEAIDTAVATCEVWIRRYGLRANARKSRLVFDSCFQPALAGVRGSETASRRLVQRAGRWIIDLRLESEKDNNRVSMTGQVLQSGEWTGAPAAGEVCVMDGDELLARTEANRFSEFQLQFPRARNLRLYVEITGERPIVVSLPESVETNPPDDALGASGSS